MAVGQGEPDVVAQTDWFLPVARLSLLVLLVNGHDDLRVLAIGATATAVLFLNERWLRSAWPWLGLAAVLGASQALDWWRVDDHRVATTYWLAALGVSRLAQEPRRTLELTARILVGFLFLLAFSWKVASSQYTSGDFFRYTLLRDQRFEPAAVILGGVEREDLEATRRELSDHRAVGSFGDVVTVDVSRRLDAVAVGFTGWGLLIEGVVAAAFLLPFRRRWHWLRPATLLAFCLTTYLLVPVVGFGVLLVTAGLAQERGRRVRRLYLATFVVVFLWGAFVAGATG